MQLTETAAIFGRFYSLAKRTSLPTNIGSTAEGRKTFIRKTQNFNSEVAAYFIYRTVDKFLSRSGAAAITAGGI